MRHYKTTKRGAECSSGTQRLAHSVMPATSARRNNFKKGVFQMKTRIGNMVIAVVMLFACLAFVVAAPVQARLGAERNIRVTKR